MILKCAFLCGICTRAVFSVTPLIMHGIDKNFISELKSAILSSRLKAARLVNKELLKLYLVIGSKITHRTEQQSWGSKVLEQVANELQKELPGLKGFSASNLKKMMVFFNFWFKNQLISSTVSNQIYVPHKEVVGKELNNLILENIEFSSTVSNQFVSSFFAVSFSNHFLIASKSNTKSEAMFYVQKSCSEFWSVRQLEYQLKANLFSSEGKLPNNFKNALSTKNRENAIQVFKDEYLLDFINIEDPDEEDEKLIENEIVRNIKKFILTLGNGFAFIGNQYRLIVEEQECFIDLLFFNRKLQSLAAIELKKGKFKPEYLGKMNFYLSALDDLVKQPHENPSIGIILCKEKNNKIVEYSFRDFNKAMGVATYKTSNEIPDYFKGVLPDAESLKNIMD